MSRKCLVLSGRSLLAQGVAKLLSLNPVMDVSVADTEQEGPSEAFRRVKPEVVIVDVSEKEMVERSFLAFLQERPGVILVCLDPLTSAAIIVRAEPRVLRDVQDLYAAIEGEEVLVKGGRR